MQRHAGRYMTFPTDITTKPSGTSRLKPLNIPDAEIDRILGECIAALNGQIAPPDGLLLYHEWVAGSALRRRSLTSPALALVK